MIWYILFGAAVGGLSGYIMYRAVRWWRGRPSDMASVQLNISDGDPPWKQYRMEDPESGDMIPVDYDPETDGEFRGNPGMIPALAAIQLQGAVMMNQLEDGTWEILGPGGVKGTGNTPSEAYGRILKQIKQDLN